MKCMHCLVEFHAKQVETHIGQDVDGIWYAHSYECPKCSKLNIFLLQWHLETDGPDGVLSDMLIRPRSSGRPPSPPEVPKEIAADYTEACLVMTDSPKASAALSRRCLQNLLRDAAKVKHGSLAQEIQEVIDSGQLSSGLMDMIDAVRNIGNFAAHPAKSKSTGEIIPVEPEEAEWNLDVLEELFDFYYVKPAIIAAKRQALNDKLNDAGKPSMK